MHLTPSNSSEIAVAPDFHSFCIHRYENNNFYQTLKLSVFQLLMIFSFWWCLEPLITSTSGEQLLWGCFWWRQLMIFRTSCLQMLSCNSSFHFVDSIALICSLEPMLYLKTLKFLSMVLHTWTNISISNWHFLIPCYHQNSKGNVKHILFEQVPLWN